MEEKKSDLGKLDTLFMRNNECCWIRPITLIPFLTSVARSAYYILLTPKQNATIAIRASIIAGCKHAEC